MDKDESINSGLLTLGALALSAVMLLCGYEIGHNTKTLRNSQYQLMIADDQKRVDKHIYDLGYCDGYEAAKDKSHVPDMEFMKREAKDDQFNEYSEHTYYGKINSDKIPKELINVIHPQAKEKKPDQLIFVSTTTFSLRGIMINVGLDKVRKVVSLNVRSDDNTRFIPVIEINNGGEININKEGLDELVKRFKYDDEKEKN